VAVPQGDRELRILGEPACHFRRIRLALAVNRERRRQTRGDPRVRLAPLGVVADENENADQRGRRNDRDQQKEEG
jgi:hypothetical protein